MLCLIIVYLILLSCTYLFIIILMRMLSYNCKTIEHWKSITKADLEEQIQKVVWPPMLLWTFPEAVQIMANVFSTPDSVILTLHVAIMF